MSRFARALGVFGLVLLLFAGGSPAIAQRHPAGLGSHAGGSAGPDASDRSVRDRSVALDASTERSESDGGIRYDGSTLSFAVGFQDQLTLTVSRDYTGIIPRCAFYDADWDTVYLFPVIPFEREYAFILHCWYPGEDASDTWSDPVPGYPVPFVCCPSGGVPGPVVDDWEVALFARNSISFSPPVPVLSPPDRQLVGVPTWLAVVSELQYPSASAAAGPVWVTVTPRFREVEWNFGDGGAVTCRHDVATTWNPGLPDARQSSRCTHTFQSNGDGTPLEGTVTVRWNIFMESNRTTPAVEFWGVAETRADLPLDIRELQAVID